MNAMHQFPERYEISCDELGVLAWGTRKAEAMAEAQRLANLHGFRVGIFDHFNRSARVRIAIPASEGAQGFVVFTADQYRRRQALI